ncbi:MAG TPA: helix-turn-helix domain-containing protein [Candidatus Faecalibacterium avium]|uniref:metal-dependent transcriptional regulator n=1 Tax=unclassified Faecalibacterium TaxID=2646395 RepID=UPI000B3AD861|nr:MULTISPECIES: helix-turn-helix domain-containing protein [unclassified Faecalibacterium]OUN74964.1 MarR family transcriptional regulator [Faecalibacterium sp. An58]OUQ38006.1 MarR family transcriptional regulator [Faecalibacterium sp. An121]HIV44215.1 helix-turn-helix domain-containing protein [Candidatus Faecalibacterium avium]
MELSAAHLRYLLAIYQTAHTQRDVSSRTIAERLGVTRPSVARALGQLMDRGMIVKAHYGKIYLTDRGIFVARRVQQQLDCVLEHFPPLALELTADEKHRAALALAAALPERLFTGEYERLFGPDDALTG